MCGRGRYSSKSKRRVGELLEHHASASQNTLNNDGDTIKVDTETVENLSPGMLCPLLVQKNDVIEINMMTWGLIPAYTVVSHKPDHFALFNKRIDTLSKPGYFRKLVERNRCVVILDGFFEWKAFIGSKYKQPYYCCFGDNPLQIAGIFEISKKIDLNDAVIDFATFSILTGEPSSKFSALHNREPVLLTHEQVIRWLDLSQNVDTLLADLTCNPLNSQLDLNTDLQFYPVTPKMSAPHYQGSDCAVHLEPASGRLMSFLKPVDELNFTDSDRKCVSFETCEDNHPPVTKKVKHARGSSSIISHPTKKPKTQTNSIQSYFHEV
jgi:putative SOS response-associated peptidase YedK